MLEKTHFHSHQLGFVSAHNVDHVLVRHQVTQPNALRYVPGTRAPHKRILERFLETAVDAVAHVLDGAVAPHNERLAKVRISALALGVDADEPQLLPAPVDDVLDAEVELAAHHHGLRLPGKLVEEVERDAVDLVVHVETLDVLAVVLHDDINEVVDRGILVTDEYLAVKHLVITQDVVDHLLVNVLGRCLERNLHTARLLRLQVNVAGCSSA